MSTFTAQPISSDEQLLLRKSIEGLLRSSRELLSSKMRSYDQWCQDQSRHHTMQPEDFAQGFFHEIKETLDTISSLKTMMENVNKARYVVRADA